MENIERAIDSAVTVRQIGGGDQPGTNEDAPVVNVHAVHHDAESPGLTLR